MKRIAATRARVAFATINYEDEVEDVVWHRKDDLDLDSPKIPWEEVTSGKIILRKLFV